ncbi:glutamate receptor 2.8-like isoform X1 [Cornus florida]|uniref:glutamate receptor 2.8-like isoform X1 n=1 Tax=Cornus florida TaxID=4283 RepID=UPI00289724D4|nr:glutamate receptor 2.8-like isoform X1 [Cornus florida]
MSWCFKFITLNTTRVPLSLLFHASFILVLTVSGVMSITEATNNKIATNNMSANRDVKADEGWAMPTVEKPMRIAVPGWIYANQFVKVEQSTKKPEEKIYSGFCIDVFEEVVRTLSPTFYLHHKFVDVNCSYDDMVNFVAKKTFDAVVGDITMRADRWKIVDFSIPFTEAGMSLVVPVKPQAPNAWMFLTPFTMELWVTTCAILLYTMFIVWLLEHRSNPEFRGPWKDQLGNILWFTFSSLFFAHRERIQRNFTRVVVVAWLFVVLIVTQTYTANLSSMLTISRLDPNVDSLKKSNAVVGCFGSDLVREYLVNVLHFKKENIRNDIDTLSQYLDALKNGSISAAFLEVPYAKLLVKRYCDQLTVTGPTYRFGGFAFVFQKGSPIATNVSAGILRLLEDGTLKRLEDEYFAPSPDCLNFQTAKNSGRLSLRHFWGLYIFYIATSTICLLLFIIHSLHHHQALQEDNVTPTRVSVWRKILPFSRFLNNASSRDPDRVPISSHAQNYIEMR